MRHACFRGSQFWKPKGKPKFAVCPIFWSLQKKENPSKMRQQEPVFFFFFLRGNHAENRSPVVFVALKGEKAAHVIAEMGALATALVWLVKRMTIWGDMGGGECTCPGIAGTSSLSFIL